MAKIQVSVLLPPDTRANQPAAAATAIGALYYVTDEGKLERNTGVAWQAFAFSGGIKPNGTVAFTADQSMGNHKLTSVTDPTSAQDAATKAYVDAYAVGLNWKQAVRLSTTVNDSLSGLAARDGVTPVANDRVLVQAQTAGAENGIYVAAAGAWSRAADADTSAEVKAGMAVFVNEGTVYGDKALVLTTNDPITLGTTALVFAQFSGASGVIKADGTVAFTGDQSMGSHKLTNVTNPSSAQDAATKAYVDALFGYDYVFTAETQAAGSGSSGFSDIATVGPSVTLVTTDTKAIVEVRAIVTKSGSGFTGFIAVAVSGATTVTPSNPNPVYPSNGGEDGLGIVGPGGLVTGFYFITGLTPGTNTFKLVYHNDGGATWTFSKRFIRVYAK